MVRRMKTMIIATLIGLLALMGSVACRSVPVPVSEPPREDHQEAPLHEPPDEEPADRPGSLIVTAKHDLGRGYQKDPAIEDLLLLEGTAAVAANQVWLLLAEGAMRKDALQIAEIWEAEIVGEIELLNAYQYQTKDTNLEQLLARLEGARKLSSVHLALPNLALPMMSHYAEVSQCDQAANDNYRRMQLRPLEMIGLSDAWIMITASGVDLHPVQVGVMDSVWSGSPEFNGPAGPRMMGISDADLMDGEPKENENSPHLHGTMVAHVLAGDHRTGGVVGVASVLGDNLTLVARNPYDGNNLRILQEEDADLVVGEAPLYLARSGNLRYVFRDLLYLKEQVEAGADIVVCTFGPAVSQDTSGTILYLAGDVWLAYERFLYWLEHNHPNVLVVSAAGNSGAPINPLNSHFGQRAANLLTVGSLDLRGDRDERSNYMIEPQMYDDHGAYSPRIPLAAPGVGIVSMVDSIGNIQLAGGTSMAAAQVAGVASLLRSIKPDLTATQLQDILLRTAAQSVHDFDSRTEQVVPQSVGGSILRADNAVLHVINLVRRERGLGALNREDLLGAGALDIEVSGGPDKYLVTVGLSAVEPTPVKLIMTAPAGWSYSGQLIQTISNGTKASWTLDRQGDYEADLAMISRGDALRCYRILFPSESAVMLRDAGYFALDVRGPTIQGFETAGRPPISMGPMTDFDLGFMLRRGNQTLHRFFAIETKLLHEKYGSAENLWHLVDNYYEWEGLELRSAYRFTQNEGLASLEASIRLQLAADGLTIRWLEYRAEHIIFASDEVPDAWLIEEYRLEGVPLLGDHHAYLNQLPNLPGYTVIGGVSTSITIEEGAHEMIAWYSARRVHYTGGKVYWEAAVDSKNEPLVLSGLPLRINISFGRITGD